MILKEYKARMVGGMCMLAVNIDACGKMYIRKEFENGTIVFVPVEEE